MLLGLAMMGKMGMVVLCGVVRCCEVQCGIYSRGGGPRSEALCEELRKEDKINWV